MNFRTLNDAQLADFADNVLTLLGGTELTAIDSNVRADLVTAIGTLPATLAADTASAMVAEDTRKAAVSDKNVVREDVVDLMAQTRDSLKAGLAPKSQYDLCGFDYPLTPPSTYVAQDPTDLSGFGYSNGVNKLKFSGNNKSQMVVYQIWRRAGDTGEWLLHGTTKKQGFEDAPVLPGQYYEYRVRAVAAKTVSNYSNSTIVYGVA